MVDLHFKSFQKEVLCDLWFAASLDLNQWNVKILQAFLKSNWWLKYMIQDIKVTEVVIYMGDEVF